MILAQNIHKSFEGLEVLKGVSLSINKGEIVSIIGASGAGKSTLLQILGTLTKSDKGSIQINNQNIQKFNSKDLSKFRNHEIGFCRCAFLRSLASLDGENALSEIITMPRSVILAVR